MSMVMKKFFYLLCAVLLYSLEHTNAQGFASSTNLYIENGATLVVKNNFSNETGGAIFNGGVIEVTGNFNNSGAPEIDEVVVLNGSTNQTITGNTVINDVLEVNKSTGSAIVASGETGIFGQLRLASGPVDANNRIVIKSDASRTGLVDDFSNPSFTGSLTSQIRVQRFLPSVNNSGRSYHYIGSAVQSPSMAELGPEISPYSGATDGLQLIPTPDCNPDMLDIYSPFNWVLEWREDGPFTQVPSCRQQGWWTRTSGNMTVGRGYSVYVPTITLEIGGLANTSANVLVSYNGLQRTNSVGDGWHLVSNPFPSPILWNLTNYNTVSSLSSGSFPGGIAVWESSGEYQGTYQSIVPGMNRMIGSSQGFFIRVLPGPAVDWALPQSVRALGDPVFYKEDYSNTIELIVRTDKFADKTTIRFGEDGETNGFDLIFDAEKLPAPGAQPTLYTRMGEYNLGINSLSLYDHPTTIPLDLIPGVSGQFTIEANQLAAFEVEPHVYIEDLKLGRIQELTNNPVYEFVSDESDDPSRFLLHFVLGEDDNLASESNDILAYVYDGTATVFLPDHVDNSSFEVFNSVGALVYSRSGLSQGKNTVDLFGFSPGAYIIRVRMNDTWYTKKVIL